MLLPVGSRTHLSVAPGPRLAPSVHMLWTTMRIQVGTSTEQLAQLRGPWNALLAQAAENTPFLPHEWITAEWQAFGPGPSTYVLTSWLDADLRLGAPLASTKQ